MTRRLSYVICGVLVAPFLAGLSLAAEMVVVASTAPGINVGVVVDSAAVFDLPAGLSVTLVSQEGKVVTLQGPYSGTSGGDTGAGDPGLVTALAHLLASSGQESGELAGVRGPTGESPDGPWMIDVSRSGEHCVPREGPVVLWRPEPREQAFLSLKLGPAGLSSTIRWAEGAATLGWPKDLPLKNGATYVAHLNSTVVARQLLLHLVPEELPTDAHRAVWMAENDCRRQAAVLLARLGAGLGPMGLYLSSDKGETPVYRIGESLTLVVRTEQDAYLTCFYRQADGSIFKIFPNRYAESEKLSGSRSHSIPALNQPFRLTITGPPGLDGVICFASDRRVAPDLPRDLMAPNLTAQLTMSEDELAKLFHRVPAAKMSEARLTVKVME